VNQGINLLRGRNQARLKIQKQAAKIRLISFLVLGVYLIAGSGLFAYLVWARKEKSQLERSIQAKKQRIVSLKKNESLHLNLKQRLAFLGAQSDLGQNPVSRSVAVLNQLAGPQITTTDFSFLGDGQITIAGETTSALALSDFFERVKARREEIKLASLTSLTRLDEGGYEFNLSLKFEEK